MIQISRNNISTSSTAKPNNTQKYTTKTLITSYSNRKKNKCTGNERKNPSSQTQNLKSKFFEYIFYYYLVYFSVDKLIGYFSTFELLCDSLNPIIFYFNFIFILMNYVWWFYCCKLFYLFIQQLNISFSTSFSDSINIFKTHSVISLFFLFLSQLHVIFVLKLSFKICAQVCKRWNRTDATSESSQVSFCSVILCAYLLLYVYSVGHLNGS